MGWNPRYCCVEGCSSKSGGPFELYSFPGKSYERERREKWIKSVRRFNTDGTPWMPNSGTRICSAHFVGGKRSNIASHPAYVPSIFARRNLKKEENQQSVVPSEKPKKSHSCDEFSFRPIKTINGHNRIHSHPVAVADSKPIDTRSTDSVLVATSVSTSKMIDQHSGREGTEGLLLLTENQDSVTEPEIEELPVDLVPSEDPMNIELCEIPQWTYEDYDDGDRIQIGSSEITMLNESFEDTIKNYPISDDGIVKFDSYL